MVLNMILVINNEGINVHPCNSFVGQMSSHANFHREANVLGRGVGVGEHMSIHHCGFMQCSVFPWILAAMGSDS